MGELRRMEPGEGDKLVAEWDVKDEATVAVSEEEFDKMMEGGGKLAYTSDGKGANTAIKKFDPNAETITVVPVGWGG